MVAIKAKREIIKEAFLENIGKVIYRNRKQKGLKGAGLAIDAGITQSEISRYETGSVDISASKMAYIADALDFDLIEYTIGIDTEQHMSQIFKELVAAGIKRPSYQNNKKKRNPKYDRTDVAGNIIPTYSLPKVQKVKDVEPPSESDDKMFEDYLSDDEVQDKVHLLEASYKIMVRDIGADSEDIKTAIRAITRYVASDHDKTMNKRLNEYLKRCQALSNMKGRVQ